ncbi:MAG: LysE family translocator [Roseovarius sp.]
MTLTAYDMLLYAGALLVLFLTPGPVWLALVARTLSGGVQAAWPLALGVVVGDVLWSLLAVLGVSWIVSEIGGIMTVLRIVAVAMFCVMGLLLILNADKGVSTDSRLTRPGLWAGFAAGLIAILGNPKAILFYMGVLPGFFDLTRVTAPDIAAIVALSFIVPLVGNLSFALFIDRVRRAMTSPKLLRRLNLASGGLMILVGVLIAFT